MSKPLYSFMDWSDTPVLQTVATQPADLRPNIYGAAKRKRDGYVVRFDGRDLYSVFRGESMILTTRSKARLDQWADWQFGKKEGV